MLEKNFAEQIVETLIAQGIKRIYGVVGDSLNPVVDAVHKHRDEIEWVHVRNEEAAAFAAGAESLLTGELACCAGSCGPGNTHLIQGLYEANRNGAKVLAIASHIPSLEIGSTFFQETHPEILFRECSHYCEMANSAEQGARILHIAIQTAIGQRGVAVFVLPGDIAAQNAGHFDSISSAVSTGDATIVPQEDDIAALAELLNQHEKVTLFVGAGVAGAHEEVIALAEKLKSPVGHALGGKEFIQYDNPYDVGMSGLLGYGACTEACNQCDVLVMIGTNFPYTAFLPKDIPVVQIDRVTSQLGRRVPLALAIQGDSKATIAALLPQIETKNDRAFLDEMLKKHERKLSHVVEAYTHDIEKITPIHPEYLADQVDRLAAEDAIFTVDTGMCVVWGARYISVNGKRRMIGSWRHGTMANALSQAIGAQFVDRKRQVVAFCGDGGLSMLMGELITVKQHDLPIKIVVFNNSSLGMVKLEMLVEGIPEYETDHAQVNYAAIAEGVGLSAVRIEDPEKLSEQLQQAFALPGAVVIEVLTDPNALAIPPEIRLEQIRGFALAAGKTVLNGGVGKMIDLAKANLRNIPR